MNNQMRYAGLKKNDIVDGEDVCVSFWTQGCPNKCKDCHNPQTWDRDGGYEVPNNLIEQIISSIKANNIQRNFSILGGEPLVDYNLDLVEEIVREVRKEYPMIKMYIWTGYLYEDLISKQDTRINSILKNIDFLIDGPYNYKLRDITLKLRGSSNQRIINVPESLKQNMIILKE